MFGIVTSRPHASPEMWLTMEVLISGFCWWKCITLTICNDSYTPFAGITNCLYTVNRNGQYRIILPSDPVTPQTPSLSRGIGYLLPFDATSELGKWTPTAKHITVITHMNAKKCGKLNSNRVHTMILHNFLALRFMYCR